MAAAHHGGINSVNRSACGGGENIGVVSQ